MRRARAASVTDVNANRNSNSSSVVAAASGFDPRRRTELLTEARRKRVAWVEEARGVEQGVHGARRRKESEAAENGRKAESELERLFPSAVRFHDFLSGLAGDPEESPGGDMSAILQPFMVQDVDIGDDRPIPSHREGNDACEVFLDKLRHPRAAEVVKSLQQFVAAFKARAEGPRKSPTSPTRASTADTAHTPTTTSVVRSDWGSELVMSGSGSRSAAGVGDEDGTSNGGQSGVTAATMSGMMHAFLGRVEIQMRQSVLWRRETEAQWEDTRECLERIVMHKVFDAAFALVADPARDEAISNRLISLGFLTEEHLGVAPLVDKPDAAASWSDAEQELSKMSSMRCPGDMLRCIIKCTRIAGHLLTGSAENGFLPGADEFLPALILLVKRANPPRVHSCLEFIQSFRDPSKLLSEAGYVLTQIVSAVCFLEEVDASVLSIAHTDFEKGLTKFKKTAREGLQAHQLEIKKEEEHARLLHSTVTSSQPDGGQDAPANVDTAGASASASGSGGGGGSPKERLPGPVTLPQPSTPKKIGPCEVRAHRLAGVRNTQLFLGNGGAAVFPTPAVTPIAETLGPLAPRSSSLPHGWPPQTHQQHPPPPPPKSSGTSAGRGSAATSAGSGVLSGHLRFVGCTASELRMSELPMLLKEHDQLARLCEELLAERGEVIAAGGGVGVGNLRRRRL